MKLNLIKSPFSAHDNILFYFIKKYVVDERIYGANDIAYPYTKLKTKYKIELTECEESVKIYFNDILYLEFDGSVSTSSTSFYVLPYFDKNNITVYDLNGNLKNKFQFKCFNIQIFLAEIAKQYKQIWNNLFQAQANTYYTENLVKDLDDEYIKPEDRYTRAIAKLLGTERYSELSDSEYFNYLHNIFQLHLNAGTLKGYYQIQQALPDYIDRIDLIPLEKYIPFKNDLYGKVFYDSTNQQNIKIYPTYEYISNEWNIINYTKIKPTTVLKTGYVYVDGEVYTSGNDIDSLKVKYTEDYEFYKREYIFVDTFTTDDIINDDDGVYTGFEDGKYVILRKPIIDGTISVSSVGDINIDDSVYFNADYNLVSLGTKYKNEITSIDISYKTFEIPNVLGQLVLEDSTNIGIINLSGHSDTDASYLSYKENNFGSVVIVIRALQQIDDELKDILNKLIRDVLPIHIRYYFIISTIGVWDNWGQENFTFYSQFDSTTGAFPTITFKDLK